MKLLYYSIYIELFFYKYFLEQLASETTGNVITNDTRRPMSPHLTIYAMQLTNTLSITFRLCGASLAVMLYTFGISSALFDISVPQVLDFVASLPAPVVLMAKSVVAVPFAYHWMNGIRHLLWDLGIGLSLKGVYTGGYTMLLATSVASLALLFH